MDIQDNNPKINPYLIGQVEAENYFYNAFSSGNLHHSWLVVGQKGIGKATLAYRIARYIFAKAKENTASNFNLNLDSSNLFDDSYEDIEQESDFFDSDDVFESQKTSENIDNKLDLIDNSLLKI